MKSIIAIDPGTTQSALVEWDGEKIKTAILGMNDDIKFYLESECEKPGILIIEQVRSYGMPVGASVFDTVFWSGRFAEAWGSKFVQVPRLHVKMHLCHTSRAKDSNIRQSLIDRFGKPPTKKEPNPVYNGFKIAKDLWASWALAVTWHDKNLTDAPKSGAEAR